MMVTWSRVAPRARKKSPDPERVSTQTTRSLEPDWNQFQEE